MSRKPLVLAERDRGPVEIDLDDVPAGGVLVDLDSEDPNAFIEVVEVDDTPEADRGKPTQVTDPLEVSEDELRSYGNRAQDRIKRLTFETQTERRGREAAERIANEATETARRALAEVERLKTAGTATATALSETMLREREAALTTARSKLAAAHNEGDGEAIAEATTEISTLTSEIAMIKAQAPRKPAPKDPNDPTPERQPQTQPTRQTQPLEPNVAAWIADNREWFGRPGHEEKTAVAYAVHERLLKSGVKPSSDAYTQGLDEGLKKVFADHQTSAERKNPPEAERETSRRAHVVGQGGRQQPTDKGSPRTVSLTASQVKLAKTLGITPQAYAASLVKHQSQQKGSAR